MNKNDLIYYIVIVLLFITGILGDNFIKVIVLLITSIISATKINIKKR